MRQGLGVDSPEGFWLNSFDLSSLLLGTWDLSILLQVPFPVSVARLAARDGGSADPAHPTLHRYVHGQHRYFEACSPWLRADLVVDNTDMDAPRLVPVPRRRS